MSSNMSEFKSNITFNKVIDLVNDSKVNEQEVTQLHLGEFFEELRTKEKEQFMVYKSVAYILGALIVLSNITVVISSGLILRKGQKPKSTYLLLGNVSLADTIIGFSIIFGVSVDNSTSSNSLCIFQMGMLVCPAMVSIFSVALIAVDRYIYILHGLYYQRWFNTTRVRIGILFIWMIGITLGFMPATGWTNSELILTRCYYVALFPGALILLNSLLSIVPLIVVAVLYSIILMKALKTVKSLNETVKKIKKKTTTDDKPKLRINRGTVNDKKTNAQSVRAPKKCNHIIKRSASFNEDFVSRAELKHVDGFTKSKSIDDLTNVKTNITQSNNGEGNTGTQKGKVQYESEFSICTIESANSVRNISTTDVKDSSNKFANSPNKRSTTNVRKTKEPNKWRAITVVMLTSGSLILTWLPFFITVIFFVFCEEKLTNPKCIHLRTLLGGPIATLAFLNSMLNPLIYAWWHKGFQKSVRTYYRRYLYQHICHIIR